MPKSKSLPSQSYLRACFNYVPLTGELIWKCRPREHFESLRVFNMWNTSFVGRLAGTRTQSGHRKVFLDMRQVLVHRVIWKWMTGDDPTHEIDHRDGDGDNNRWVNLREATRTQNGQNRLGSKRRRDALPKGVRSNGITYSAKIVVNGIRHKIGVFDSPEEAHQAYRDAVFRYHGEFANPGPSVVAQEADIETAFGTISGVAA